MKSRWVRLFSVLVVMVLLLSPAAPAAAQDGGQPPQPPARVDPRGEKPQEVIEDEELLAAGLMQGEDGLYAIEGAPLTVAEEEVEAAASYSSADKFGYRYQKVTPAWLDATGGTRLEFEYYDEYAYVELPFAFRFYGKKYEQMNVAMHGYLTFTSSDSWADTQSSLGSPFQPNNVIAPYWAPLSSEYSGGVYVLSGGDAPNRWVAIEWHDVQDRFMGSETSFTFETILYENGQVLFQYGDMDYSYSWYCGTSGIEDRSGLIYKTILKFCYQQADDKAYKIVPPKPAARIYMLESSYGNLGLPGETVYDYVYFENNGDLGDDVFDLTLSSKWPAQLLYNDGDDLVPLTDTDGDRKIDTGPLSEGEVFMLIVGVTVPPGTAVGKRSDASLKIVSSLNKSKSKTARISTAVPAAFAQLYQLYDNMLLTFGAEGTREYRTYGEYDVWLNNSWITESAGGRLFYTGTEWGCLDDLCEESVSVAKNVVMERNGSLLTQTWVEPLDTVSVNDYSYNVTSAAAPDGSVGVAWTREHYDEDLDANLSDIYFARLDQDGNPLIAPVNLTQTDYIFEEEFYRPTIAAIAGGKFAVSWQQYRYEDFNEYNIGYAVINADGSFVSAPAVIAQGAYDGRYYTSHSSPTMTALANGSTLMAWRKYIYKYSSHKYSYYVEYAVVNGAGVIQKRSSIATGSAAVYDLDSAQMSGGQIVLTWNGYSSNKYKIYYAILSGTTYKKSKGPTTLNSSSSLSPSQNVSVTVDAANHAVLTWMNISGTQLYYTLLGKNGAIITKPMVYRTGWYDSDYDALATMYVDYRGGANTTLLGPVP